ncbi:hypothetical protein ASC54_07815 [Yonghaparkia sp. Root332]|nr:hypothetical protein ASC54_07815 [Yonghaparkia sp. Root332]
MLAARNARRALGRSILIVLMMAVPVAGMAATAVVVASSNATAQELVDLRLGEAASVAQVVGPPGSVETQAAEGPLFGGWQSSATPIDQGGELVDPRRLLDGRIVEAVSTVATIDTDGRLRQVQATAGDVFVDELAAIYVLREGSAPSSSRELVVSPALADDLALAVGSIVTMQPDGVDRTVVGIGLLAHDSSDTLRVFGTIEGLGAGDASAQAFAATYFALDHELSWREVQSLNEQGVIATSRSIVLGAEETPGALPVDPIASLFGFQGQLLALAAMIAAFLLLQVVLLAGAAFMVGARQQQRSLAVLGSVGGDHRTVRAVVSAGGLVLGLVGSLLGLALGIAGGAIFLEVTRNGSSLQYPGFHLDPVVLGLTVLVATGAGWLAAAIPARIATRLDIVTALRGARRPARPGPRVRRSAIGLIALGAGVLAAGGVALVVLRTLEEYPPVADVVAIGAIAVGAIVLQVGVLLALPAALRALARATAAARTPLRLAARDSARNAARTVPVAAAVMTTVFLSSFLMSVFGAAQLESEQWYTPQAPLGSVMMSARDNDPLTDEIAPIDDLDALVAGVAEIADAPATLLDGVYVRDYWFDPRTGENLDPPQGATVLTVALDEEVVCPDYFGPPVGTSASEITAFYEAVEDDPRCAPGIDGGLMWSNPLLSDSIRVGDVTELEAATGMRLDAASREALDAGGVVALHPAYAIDGEATLRWIDAVRFTTAGLHPQRIEAVRSAELPAVLQEPPTPVRGALLMSAETARELELEVTPLAAIAYPEQMPGGAEENALLELSRELTGDPWSLQSVAESGPDDIVGPAAWSLVALSGAIALTASAIAIGLARIDGRRDEAILGAIGATRRLRRAVSFWQAVLLAGIGALVGAALGILTAGALALPGGPMLFSPPPLQLAIAALGVPLVIAVGAWLLAGRATALPTDRSAIA